jgi:hypothetical protein
VGSMPGALLEHEDEPGDSPVLSGHFVRHRSSLLPREYRRPLRAYMGHRGGSPSVDRRAAGRAPMMARILDRAGQGPTMAVIAVPSHASLGTPWSRATLTCRDKRKWRRADDPPCNRGPGPKRHWDTDAEPAPAACARPSTTIAGPRTPTQHLRWRNHCEVRQ